MPESVEMKRPMATRRKKYFRWQGVVGCLSDRRIGRSRLEALAEV